MIITLKTSQILPSQDFLKPGTVKYILNSIKNNNLDNLPPAPVVRYINDSYVALDGHNLIAVMEYLGKDIEVFVVSTESDKLAGTDEASNKRNKAIELKFDELLTDLKTTQENKIYSFKDLIKKYSQLFNSGSL